MEVIFSENPKILFHSSNNGKIFYLTNESNTIISYICDPKNDIWTFISKKVILSIEILDSYKDDIDWDSYSKYNNLTHKIVENFSDKLVWPLMYYRWMEEKKIISEKYVHFIKKSINNIYFGELYCISRKNKKWFYSSIFIDCFPEIVDWGWIIKNIKLPIFLLDSYWLKIKSYSNGSDELYKRQDLSDIDFLKKWYMCINWKKISKYQILSNNHFNIFYKELDWTSIFSKYIIDLEELQQEVIYNYINDISETQNLNNKFIIINIDILNPEKMLKNKNIQNNIIDRIYKNCSEKYIYTTQKGNYIKFGY